jgi:glucan phosphorylase
MSNHLGPAITSEAEYENFRKRLIDNIWHKLGQAIQLASLRDAHMALSLTVRDQLIERYRETVDAMFAANPKSVCFFSAEYLTWASNCRETCSIRTPRRWRLGPRTSSI